MALAALQLTEQRRPLLAKYGVRGTLINDSSVVQLDDFRLKLHGFSDVMGDGENGSAGDPLPGEQPGDQFLSQGCLKPGKRLIQQQNGRIGNECGACEADAPGLSAGEPGRKALQQMLGAEGSALPTERTPAEEQILADGEMGEERSSLRGERSSAAMRRQVHSGRGPGIEQGNFGRAEEANDSGLRSYKPCNRAKKGGLARAGGPEKDGPGPGELEAQL